MTMNTTAISRNLRQTRRVAPLASTVLEPKAELDTQP